MQNSSLGDEGDAALFYKTESQTEKTLQPQPDMLCYITLAYILTNGFHIFSIYSSLLVDVSQFIYNGIRVEFIFYIFIPRTDKVSLPSTIL